MKRLLHSMTWMAIWLLLTLPVAFSDNILTVQKFAGRDNVPNFAKEGDELTIQVLAQMLGNPTPEVAKQRARVFNGDTYAFMDSCTAQANNIQQCTYKTTDLVYAGTDEYAIKLYDGDNKEIAVANRTLTVDFLGPKITQLSVSPNMTGVPVPTTITYKVEDYGRETGKLTNCAGIKLINITANNAPVALITANLTQCSKQGTFVFTPTISGPSARVTVCAVAADYLNHKSLPVCKDILIDSRKPTAEALELRDSEGYVMTHARSNQPIIAEVAVKIPDVDVDGSKVYADLSKLNPNLGRLPRTSQSGEWFIWKNVQVTSPNTCQVKVDARDLMGNNATTTLTCTIGIDDTAPVPGSITTQFVDDDSTPLLGINGTIHASFTESGSGLDKRNAFLDLRQLGSGAEVKADQCDRTGTDTWDCAWRVRPAVPSGDHTVKLLPTTRDDLNNQISGTVEQVIRFDNTAPDHVRLKEIAAFRGQARVKTNVTSLGETLEFVVTGAGYKTVVADFTELGGGEGTQPDRCTGNATRDCTFSFTTAVSGPQPTNITFDFSDIAGNKASISTSELFILGINNETAPNYWNITAECSPTLLDRKTLSVFEHPVYCRVAMKTTNKRATPITIEGPTDFSQCTGDTQYISSLNIENNYAGSSEPYIVLSLVATDYAINNLSVTCPLSTLTRIGNFMPQNPEQDNATINLNFYNLPLGELYDNIDSDVKDAKDSTKGVWKVIGELQKFIGMAEKLCQILNIIMTVISTIVAILALIAGVEVAADAVDLGIGNAVAEALRATETSMCNPTEALRQVFNEKAGILSTLKKFCDFLTCQASLLELVGANFDLAGGIGFYDVLDPSGSLGVQQLVAKNGEIVHDPASYLNVKDSLIYSIIIPPLCIPGIIYNLDKWRQTECRYGLCLLQDVRQNGMPISVCKDQKSYMQCRFIMGEIFNIIPFAAIVSYWLNLFQQAISDPLVLASVGIAYILNCNAACQSGYTPGFAHNICAGMAIASQLGYTIKQIKNLKGATDFGSVGNQWCDQFEDALKDYESEKEQGGGTLLGGGV